jgi:CobQ-like glutamine amidotransferase family enzyme
MSALRILHLYSAELGINGDRGNVLALQRRLSWRGIKAEIIECGIGDAPPAEAELVHIGSGPRAARDAVLPSLLSHAALLHDWAAMGVPMIAIGAGFHLLGTELVDESGRSTAGVGLLPVRVQDVGSRAVGEVLGTAGPNGRLAGYVNHGVHVELHGADPLVVLDRGWGNAGLASDTEGRAEGVRRGDLVGTHLHGPVLPMNPALADDLLASALRPAGVSLPEADERTRLADDYARRSRHAIAARLGRPGVAV